MAQLQQAPFGTRVYSYGRNTFPRPLQCCQAGKHQQSPNTSGHATLLDPSEWAVVLEKCLRRIWSWRVPPDWSVRDWFAEMKADGAAAAWQAVCDYDPSRGVPFSAFVWQRVMTRTFTRYRQEWNYARRCVSEPWENGHQGATADSDSSTAVMQSVRCALEGLPGFDQWLIEQLYWEGSTETEIAECLGISQQAVSKRRRFILRDLRAELGVPEKSSSAQL